MLFIKSLCNRLHFRTSSLSWGVWRGPLLKRLTGRSGSDITTNPICPPPVAWLIRAKWGQGLYSDASTVSKPKAGVKTCLPRSTGCWLQTHGWQALEEAHVPPTGSSQGQCWGRGLGLLSGPKSSQGHVLLHFLRSSGDIPSSFRRGLAVFDPCQPLCFVSKFHQNIFMGSKCQ